MIDSVRSIVLKQGAAATPEELRAHLAATLQTWQLPDAVVFVTEIPRTSTGKVKKAQLREMFPSWEWEKK